MIKQVSATTSLCKIRQYNVLKPFPVRKLFEPNDKDKGENGEKRDRKRAQGKPKLCERLSATTNSSVMIADFCHMHII